MFFSDNLEAFNSFVNGTYSPLDTLDLDAAVTPEQFSTGLQPQQSIAGFDTAYYLTENLDNLTEEDDLAPILLSLLEYNSLVDRGERDSALSQEQIRSGQDIQTILGGEKYDLLLGNKGDDTLSGTSGNDLMFGLTGNDRLYGQQGNDVIGGNQGDDLLNGGEGKDGLFGDRGNDTLWGDRGSDLLWGGSGSDRFAIGQGTGGSNVTEADYIIDFREGDIIELTDNLTYDDLNISQGTGDRANDTIIQNAVTGEYLAILIGIDRSQISKAGDRSIAIGSDDSSGGTSPPEPIPTPTPPSTPTPTPTASTLAFSEAEFSVREDGTPITAITVTRTDGTQGEVSVTLTPSDGTATSGDDYTADPIAVTFKANETTKTVEIPIVNDSEVEESQTVNLTLSNPTNKATLGSQNTAILTIVDDDEAIAPTSSLDPGNTLETAKAIGTLQGTRPFNEFVGAADTLDYYQFTLGTQSNFSVVLDNLSSNADVELLDSSGNPILSSANPNTTADAIATILAAGDYYVRIDSTTDTNYSLNLSSQSITGPAYYVSSEGNDANAGTFDQPFKTIQKAATLAQAGETVYIRGGTYRENVQPLHSGTADQPISFTAYANEEVTISGTEIVSGWTQHNGNVYKTTLNAPFEKGSNQLFVNGDMMVEARWPNIPGDPATITRENNAISDTGTVNSAKMGVYTDSDLTHAANLWKGAKINFLGGWNWTPKTGEVVSNVPGQLNFSFPDNGQKQYQPQAQNSYYLWDKYEALDTAKEWYYDEGADTLYLWSPNSDSPSNYTVEAKQREFAIEILGKSYINVENINVFGAGIKVWQSNNVILDGIESRYGTHAQLFDDPNQVWESVPPSIRISQGTNNQIKNSYIAYSAGSGIGLFQGSGNQVTNSVIHDIGYAATNASAIGSTGPQGEISNNTLFNSGSRLINLYGTNQGKVAYNELYNGGLQASDFGAISTIDTDGKGTEIAYNSIHDMNAPADLDLNYYGSAGILLERSKNFNVHHNVIYDTSIEGFKYFDASGVGSLGVEVSNNTIDGEILLHAQSGTLNGAVVKNNIYIQAKYRPNDKGVVSLNNFELSGLDPFVNRANHNYQLIADAPNIGTGAIEFGQEHWTPGAVISQEDVYSLNVEINAPQNGTIDGQISGLPIGRKLPTDFKLIVGNAPASGDFYSTDFDPVTNLSTVTFTDVAVGSQTGVQPLYVQFGNHPPIDMEQWINLS